MKLFTLVAASLIAAASLSAEARASDCSASRSTFAVNVSEGGKTIVDTALAAGNFKTLAKALGAAGLVETLQGAGPFTVLAPTDDAFAKVPRATLEALLDPKNKELLTNVLTYHVVPGKVMAAEVLKLSSANAVNGQRLEIRVIEGSVVVDGAKVTKTDIVCSNGVIHVLDAVLMPATKSIVELAKEAGTFDTLLAAAEAAGLAETLGKDGPFTVFAPTDDAFARLPKGTVESLLLPENKAKLVAVLKNHVVSGRVFADQVTKLDKAQTIDGKSLAVETSPKGVKIGAANVV